MDKKITFLLLVFSIFSIFAISSTQIVFAASGQTSINLEQCHNGNPDIADCDDPEGNENNWGQGNANHQNSFVREEDSQNYRIVITDLPAGRSVITIL